DLGAIDPEHVITPGIFVKRIVQVERLSYDPTPAKRGEQNR
ncbi:MAG: 3-oxoadipate CoA-transferase, partial [Betaproteobacteria bacterium]|nr:3-oxoadipate CoA-transferase [Betaproteobacteria bacterium]